MTFSEMHFTATPALAVRREKQAVRLSLTAGHVGQNKVTLSFPDADAARAWLAGGLELLEHIEVAA